MKNLKRDLRRWNRNRRYNKKARARLAAMAGDLPNAQRAQCDAYAADVLGSRAYAPWLYVYAKVAGEFREGWIPDNYYANYIAHMANIPSLAGLRALQTRLFQTDAFPDLACRYDGRTIATTGEHLSKAALVDLLFRADDKVIFKQDQSLQGTGIAFFSRADIETMDLETLGNGVFQRIIQQHSLFDPVSPGSLATIRITTAINPAGETSTRGTYLRLGRARETHVQSKSAVSVSFDIQTGQVADWGLLPDWNKVTHHPDAGGAFADITLPNIKACADLVIGLHKQMPFYDCLGWDLALDQDARPHILEWNSAHNDIKFSEATQGPWFKDMGWEDRWRSP